MCSHRTHPEPGKGTGWQSNSEVLSAAVPITPARPAGGGVTQAREALLAADPYVRAEARRLATGMAQKVRSATDTRVAASSAETSRAVDVGAAGASMIWSAGVFGSAR